MRRVAALLFSLTVSVSAFIIPAYAQDGIGLPDEYRDFTDSIPEDIAGRLPEEFFSGDASELADAVSEMSSGEMILTFLWELVTAGTGGALSMFTVLVALGGIGALLSQISGAKGELSSAVGYGTSLCVSLATVGMQYSHVLSVSGYFSRLTTVMSSMLPLMGVLYTAGGDAARAAVNNSAVILWLDLIGIAVSSLILPGVSACMAIALADSLRVGEIASLAGVSGSVKRTLVFVLGLCSTLMMAALGAQSIVAAASDSVGARTVKYIAGNMIPVVGSTVGETLRTVASSVRLLRGSVGVAGIVIILWVLLPVLVELMMCRFALNSAAAVCDMIASPSPAKLYRELASLYGYLIAAAALCALLCIFALTTFAVSSSAAGGL